MKKSKNKCGIGKIYDSKIKSCRKMSKSEKKTARSYGVKKGLSKAAEVAAMAAGGTKFTGVKASKSFKKQTARLAAFRGVAKGLTDYSK